MNDTTPEPGSEFDALMRTADSPAPAEVVVADLIDPPESWAHPDWQGHEHTWPAELDRELDGDDVVECRDCGLPVLVSVLREAVPDAGD